MRRGDKLSDWDKRLVDKILDFISDAFSKDDQPRGPRIKFVGYQEFMDFLKQPGCAVCRLINASLRHYISVAFVEDITNPEFRAPLRTSLGYCRSHSRLVRVFSAGKLRRIGVAIVYEDLLSCVEQSLDQNIVRLPADCPMCGFETELESYALTLICDYANDVEFQTHYQRSAGVCLPHLQKLLGQANGAARSFLLTDHRRKLERLMTYLGESIRKNGYQFRAEPMTDEEKNSWTTALYFIVGEPEFLNAARS